jgi:hypothetical protein
MSRYVILFNPYVLWDFHFNVDVSVYHNLISRGYAPIFLRCGNGYKTCDLYWKVSGPRPVDACSRCNINTKKISSIKGIESKTISDFITEIEYQGVLKTLKSLDTDSLIGLKFRGVDVSHGARNSTHNHFRLGSLNYSDPEVRSIFIHYLHQSICVVMASSRVFSQYRPEAVVVFNGRQAQVHAFLETAKNHNIRVTSHERGFTRGSFLTFVNSGCDDYSFTDKLAKERTNSPLRAHQVHYVWQWLNERILGRNFSAGAFNRSDDETINQQNTDFTSISFCLFTSSEDELINQKSDKSWLIPQKKWIEEVIKTAKELTSHTLVIRVHPHSRHSASESAYFESLKAECCNDRNIKIILADDRVNSYDLLKRSVHVLAYASIVAVEALLLGRKVFLASPFYWHSCPGIDSFETYSTTREWMLSAKLGSQFDARSIDMNQRCKAFRFVYELIRNIQISLPYLIQQNENSNRLNITTHKDLSVGEYPTLDKLVDIVLGEVEQVRTKYGYVSEDSAKEEMSAIENLKLVDDPGPILSVIVVNYNYGRYLERCIRSIASGGSLDSRIEIIIVDDQSTDNSKEVICKLQAEFQGSLRVVWQEHKGQPAYGRNSGISLSKGRYILPIDADDEIEVGYIDGIIRVFEQHPEADLVYSNTRIQRADGVSVVVSPGKFSLGHLIHNNQIVISSAFTRFMWEEAGGYSTNVVGYEDWDLWVRLAYLGATARKYEGVGLIYYAKDDGLYGSAKKNHSLLYKNILINNHGALRLSAQYFARRLND